MVLEVILARCRLTIRALIAGLCMVKDAAQQLQPAVVADVGEVGHKTLRMAVEVFRCFVVLKPPDAVAHHEEVADVHLGVVVDVLCDEGLAVRD